MGSNNGFWRRGCGIALTIGRKRLIGWVLVILVLLACEPARADRRGYVWTYEYLTMPKGEAEIEYYLTVKVPDGNDFRKKNIWEHQFEFEYGLTDRWDVSIYQRWKQTNIAGEHDFAYTGTKLRTRYRFGEKGMYPLDMLLYLEYIIPNASGASDILEGKIILAKDFGSFNIAYNQILKVDVDRDGETEHEYALGFNYEFSPALKIGLESKGNLTEDKFYLGPTVSWSSEKFWVAAGALGGLNDRSDDYQLRLIIGIPLF